MTTLNHTVTQPATRIRHAVPAAEVFGVSWPLYKLHALAVAGLVLVVVLAAGGSGATAMWTSASALLLVWWGERAALAARWDDGGRDHHTHF